MIQNLWLIAYGIIVAALGFFVGQSAPVLGRTSFITGLAVGLLSVLWGVWALAGLRKKAPVLLTLIAGTFIFLSQTVMAWTPEAAAKPPGLVPVLITLMLLLSLGTLMKIAYAATFSSPPPANRPK